MGAIFRGASVIPTSQTILNWTRPDYEAGPPAGALWRWTGPIVRLEAARPVEELEDILGRSALVAGARARIARRTPPRPPQAAASAEMPVLRRTFHVSDGRRRFPVSVLPAAGEGREFVLFPAEVPPRDTDLTVVETYAGEVPAPRARADHPAQVCFTPGTLILTPTGPRPVEQLEPGDRVITRDSGVQRLYWTARRRVGGARMLAMPGLRPVRIMAGALGDGLPEADLWLSGDHRVLLRGPVLRDMLGEDEGLAPVRDLVDDRRIRLSGPVRETVYMHLLFERHEIIWAEGVEAETFHPADCAPETLDEVARIRLFELFPEIVEAPAAYGPHARRILRAPEAAIAFARGGTTG